MAKLQGGTVIYGTGTVQTTLFVQGTTTATSTITGAVVVTGGVGIGGALYAGNIYSNGALIGSTVSTTTTDTFFINNATVSSSTITGALRVLGGVGIGGQVNVFNTLTVGPISAITLPNTIAQFNSNVNSYSQIHVQNSNAGNAASTDFILTKDTGNDSSGFIDLGINNSGYSQAGVFDVVGAGSGYLYVNGGDLALGTDGAYTVRVFAGGTLTANEQVRINTTGMGIKTTSPGSALDVKGTIRLSGATSGYVGLSPASVAGSTTYTLPAADGTAGQVLQTSGGATLSWATPAGGVSGALLVTLQQQFGGF